jgi:uncharacterized membrane protein
MKNNKQPLIAGGLLLGIGLGGFFDGIVFHQILQAHNMLSNLIFPNTLENIEINMFWDGLFHAFTWISTLFGVIFLWHGLNTSKIYSGKYFIGLFLLGWGIFNSVEGSINHLILKLHHTFQRSSYQNQLYSDLGFVLSGILLGVLGLIIINKYKYKNLNTA